MTTLQNTSYPSLKKAKLSVLVRGESKATFFRQKGIETEVIESAGQLDLLRKIASKYDSKTKPRTRPIYLRTLVDFFQLSSILHFVSRPMQQTLWFLAWEIV